MMAIAIYLNFLSLLPQVNQHLLIMFKDLCLL